MWRPLLTFTALSFLFSFAFSFMPAKLGTTYAGYTPGNTRTHAKQTEDEIAAFILDQFGIEYHWWTWTSSMRKARDAIIEANKMVDDTKGVPLEKDLGEAHFDDELFVEGQQRLMDLRTQMIGALQTFDVASARTLLGRQLHTLQDFYAHSNWVEMGNREISDIIGVTGQTGYPPNNVSTCSEFCGNSNDAAYMKSIQCADDCKYGDQTVGELFQSYTCFQVDLCSVPDCSANLLDTDGVVTSGYYLTEAGSGVQPPGKCTHGGLSDAGAEGIEGINKDSEWAVYAPHGLVTADDSNWHQIAADLSQQATQNYFQQFVQDPVLGGPALTETQLRQLFGLGAAPLVFVIDTTGSMGDVIEAVQEATIDVVNKLKGTVDEPSSYTLMAYNDPAGSDITTTGDADEFIDALNSLFASGGGDCPEPANEALLVTLNQIDKTSNVFLFTDAQDSDPENVDAVIDLALDKLVRLNFFLFPSGCSDGSSYQQLADATTGSFIPMPDRGGADDMTQIALQLIDPNMIDVYTDYPTSSTSSLAKRQLGRRDGPSEVSIAADSTMASLIFRAAGAATLTVTRPDGSTVEDGDSNVSYFANGAITFITITSPEPGTWRATRSDTTDGTALSVFASSWLTLNSFSFVEIRGGHPAWFPITDPLVAGTTYTVNADIDGTFDVDHFEFRSSVDGSLLQTFTMNKLDNSNGSSDEHIWYADVASPCGTFYAYAYGSANGTSFQRVWPQVFNTTTSDCANFTTNSTTTTSSSSSTTSSITISSTTTITTTTLTSSSTTTAATTTSSTTTSATTYATLSSTSTSQSYSWGNGTSTLASGPTTTTQSLTTEAYTTPSVGTTMTTQRCSTCSLQTTSTWGNVTFAGQGVPMTTKVSVISVKSMCPYTFTIEGCSIGHCTSTGYSTSLIPDKTTTLLVPLAGATPAYSPKLGSGPAPSCKSFNWPPPIFTAFAHGPSGGITKDGGHSAPGSHGESTMRGAGDGRPTSSAAAKGPSSIPLPPQAPAGQSGSGSPPSPVAAASGGHGDLGSTYPTVGPATGASPSYTATVSAVHDGSGSPPQPIAPASAAATSAGAAAAPSSTDSGTDSDQNSSATNTSPMISQFTGASARLRTHFKGLGVVLINLFAIYRIIL